MSHGYPVAAQAYPQQPRQSLPYAQRPQGNASRTAADNRQPQFRMQKGDDSPALPPVRPEPLRMPSPAELGLGSTARAQTEAVDWADVRRRMERLGVTGFQLDRTATGFRFTCVVDTRRLSADAPTEAEAIHQALARVEVLR